MLLKLILLVKIQEYSGMVIGGRGEGSNKTSYGGPYNGL